MPPADKVAAALRNGLLAQRPPAVAESRRWTAGNLLLSVLDDHEECQICFHREIDTVLLWRQIGKICKLLAGSFLAVSKPIFARKYAFDSIFQALQDLHLFAPLQSQNFRKKIGLKKQRLS